MGYPKISIVTPSFQQADYLEHTIRSVLDQEYPNLEYIVIDGGSDDGSKEIIERYSDHLSYWISEPDQGQSDAINKGIARVSGDLFNWLNSDDLLEPGALHAVGEAFFQNPEAELFCFQLSHMKEGERIPFGKGNDPSDPLQCYCEPVINQQSSFYSSKALTHLDRLNPSLHYTMDYEWWMRFILHFGKEAIYSDPRRIAVYRLHEAAKTGDQELFVNDMATVHAGMCERVGANEYKGLLMDRFEVDPNYSFPDPIDPSQKELIERMAFHFLLKWGRLVHSKEEFEAAKRIERFLALPRFQLTKVEEQWWAQLRYNVAPWNWSFFRLRRKFFARPLKDVKAP